MMQNPALNPLAGFYGEIDNINAPGTDLGIRTNNVNGSGATSAQSCLLYTSPSPRDATLSRMPSSA